MILKYKKYNYLIIYKIKKNSAYKFNHTVRQSMNRVKDILKRK